MVQPAEVPIVCDGMMPARFWPRPSRVSRSRNRYSRAAASGLLRNECNSREDSWMKREARVCIVRAWR